MNILEKNLEIRSLDSGKFKYDQKVIKTAPNVFYETIIENNIVTSNGVVYNNIEYENTPLVSINRQPLSTSTETNKKVKSLTFSIDKTLLYNIDKGIFELTPITTMTVLITPYNTFKKDNKGNYIWSNIVEFQVNSKHLLTNYFEGINSKSIQYIYDYIQKCGFEISEEDFFNGKMSDADFKFDIILEPKEYKSIVKIYKDSSKKITGVIPPKFYNEKTNQGIDFNKRELATIEAQKLKIYNKYLEMLYNSNVFKNHYLNGIEIDGVYRWEYTLKNTAHFKKYGINNTIGNVLNLLDTDQNKFKEISSSIHNFYLHRPNQNNLIVKSNSIDAMEIYQKSLITAYIELGKSDNEILQIILESLKNVSASTLKRHKADIKTILQQIATDKKAPNNKKLLENIRVNNTMEMVGYKPS